MSGVIYFKDKIDSSMGYLGNVKSLPVIDSINNHKHNLEKIKAMKQIGGAIDYTEKVINFLPSETNEINEIFTNVVELIKLQGFDFLISDTYLKNERVMHDSLQIKRTIGEFKKKNPQPIDYDKHWLAFNQNYFLKNLYKAFVTVKYIQSNNLIQLKTDPIIIDVGCGAGVCTIAWSRLFGKCTSKIILIDQNKFQLKLSQQITRTFKGNKFEYRNESFPGYFDQLRGIRLFSYFFCEQKDYNMLFNASNISKLIGEGALIVDYEYIIDKIIHWLNPMFKCTRWTIIVKEVPQILAEENKKEQYIYGAYIKP